jgi:hypothetical protein
MHANLFGNFPSFSILQFDFSSKSLRTTIASSCGRWCPIYMDYIVREKLSKAPIYLWPMLVPFSIFDFRIGERKKKELTVVFAIMSSHVVRAVLGHCMRWGRLLFRNVRLHTDVDDNDDDDDDVYRWLTMFGCTGFVEFLIRQIFGGFSLPKNASSHLKLNLNFVFD